MKISVEKLPTSEAVLDVELSWDEVEKASDKAYRKLVRQVDVPGFRRGKAPRSLIERRLGKEYIYQEGLDELISETYRNAVNEYNLTPITQPELDAPVFEMGQPYHFTMKVPVLTPVELGDYTSLHIDREEPSVTSEEVEDELEALRNRQAMWRVVERPAEYGDRVTVDLKLTVEDKTISDLKDNPFELTRERHGLFTGLDEHIVGMQAGESKEFSTTLPQDYTNEKLAGKEAFYSVTLHKVEVKEVPELDDDFASKVSDGQYETLEDLRKALSDNIFERKKRRIDEELRDKVVDAVIEQSQVTLHPLLVREEAEHMLHELAYLLERQHMSLDQYLLTMRKSREEYIEDSLPEAEQRLKRQLVLDAVADKEGITVSPEDVEMLWQMYAQGGEQPTDAQLRTLEASLRREKAITRLVELIAGPEPEAEIGEEEASIANAKAAALVGENLSAQEEGEVAAGAGEELAEAPTSEVSGTVAEAANEAQASTDVDADNAEAQAQ